jgi:hypothetical protein
MAEMSDFQKQFLSKGVGNQLFTQKEFDDALAEAKAEIMAMAIEASRTAVMMEREACAKIVDEWANSMAQEPEMLEIAEAIRNRIPSQRQ